MAYLDFDTVVIYDVNIDDALRFKDKNLFLLVKYLTDNGIRKIIFLYDAPASLNQKDNFIKRTSVKLAINEQKFRGLKFYVAPNVKLSANELKRSDIKCFTLPRTDKIFLQLPTDQADAYILKNINMLRSKKLIPVFTAFERDCFSVRFRRRNDDFIPRLLWMKKAYFCIDIRQLAFRKNWIYMNTVLNNYKAKILPCISADPNKYRYKPTVIDLYSLMRKRLGDKKYLSFCKHINECSKSFFEGL